MFNPLKNKRSIQAGNTIGLVQSMVATGVNPAKPIVVSKDMALLDAEILQAYYPESFKLFLNGKLETLARADVLAKVMEKYKAEYPVVLDGNHRAAAWLVASLYDANLAPLVTIVSDSEVAAWQGNLADTLIARLKGDESITAVAELIRLGVYKRESDIPAKRGMQQTLWAGAQLVRLGMDAKEVAKLDKEARREVLKADADGRETMLAVKVAEKGTNKPKSCTREEVESVRAQLDKDTYQHPHAATVRDVLDGILSGDKSSLELACGLGVKVTVTPATVDTSKGKGKGK